MTVVLTALAAFTLGYFTVLNGLYLVFTGIAWNDLARHLRRIRHAPTEAAFGSPLTPGITVILPAYNEQAGIVESVRALLALRYPKLEIMVVNDGSSDETLSRLHEAFDLAPVRKVFRDAIATSTVRGAFSRATTATSGSSTRRTGARPTR